MAVKTYRLGTVPQVDGNFAALFEADQSAATRADGWGMGKTGIGLFSEFDVGVSQASGTFDATAKPASFITGTTANAFKTPTALTGAFANSAWTFTFALRTGVGGGQQGRVRLRVFRSVNASGASATEITGATQVGTICAAIQTSSDVTSVVTWTPGAPVNLNNEFLFFVLAWEITTAASSTSATSQFRTGQAAGGTRIVTPDFAIVGSASVSLTSIRTTAGVVRKNWTGSSSVTATVAVTTNGVASTPPTGTGYASRILSLNPLAYYRLGSSQLLDSSGHGLTLQAPNGTMPVGASLLTSDPADVSGDFGDAFHFLLLNALSPPSLSGNAFLPRSIEVWIRPDTLPTTQCIIRKDGFEWCLRLNGGNVEYFFDAPLGFGDFITTGAPISAGQTYHVVVTDDATTIKFYVNGNLHQSFTRGQTGNNTHGGPIGIGLYYSGPADWFDGRIDELALYGTALSAADVHANYIAGSAYATAILAHTPKAYIRLGESSGTVAANEVGAAGSYYGSPALGVAGAITDPNTAMSLDGGARGVDLPSSLSIPAGSSITVEWWQYIATADVRGCNAFRIGNSGSPDICSAHAPFSDQILYWDYGVNSTGVGRVTTSYTAYLDKWALVQLTYDAAATKHAITLNGVEVASLVSSNTPTVTLTGGFIGGGSVGFMKGSVDEFAVYDYALTPAQRLAHYNAGIGAAAPTTYFGSATVTLTDARTTAGTRQTFAATTVPLVVARTTSGVRKTLATASVALLVGTATAGKLTAKTSSAVALTVSRTTSAIRKTFAASTVALVNTRVTAGVRKTFAAATAALVNVRTTVGQLGARASSGVRGETVTVFANGFVVGGPQTYFGSATVTVTNSRTTSGTRKTFAASSVPLVVARTTTGKLTVRTSSTTPLVVARTTAARVTARTASATAEMVLVWTDGTVTPAVGATLTKRWTGSAWTTATVRRWNGAGWVPATVKRRDPVGWK